MPVRITGAVVRMRRSGPRGGGHAYGCGCSPAPRSRTSGSRWTRRRTGSRATPTSSGCRSGCSGRLESRGGFRRLTGASGVGPVQVDEAERDRLHEVAAGECRLLRGGVQRRLTCDGSADRSSRQRPFRGGRPRLGTIRLCAHSGMAPQPTFSQERPVSDVRVIIQRDSEREERVVTTGTTAAELFAGERIDRRRARRRRAEGPRVRAWPTATRSSRSRSPPRTA